MKVLELFSGTGGISKTFARRGHRVYTVDYNPDLPATSHADVGTLTIDDIIKICDGSLPDVVWASPDCTTYSVAGIAYHREKDPITKELIPWSNYAKKCDKINEHLIELIKQINPKFWFIENPRGGFRKMHFIAGLDRFTVTYCQYGYSYMKPTDIFTNHPNPRFKPPCHNGDKCHTPAPRGARSGLEAQRDVILRSEIPTELCDHIVDICEQP